MTQTFTQDVLIDGSTNTTQLQVQANTTQSAPLQAWQTSSGSNLGQVTSDGRLEMGDNLATPDAFIEAHRLEASTTKPKRGFHSLGQIGGTLNAIVQWVVTELELRGSGVISAVHSALRVKVTNYTTGIPSGSAELRAGDFEVANDTLASTSPLPRATGLQVTVSNAAGKTMTEAVGLRVSMNNSGTITNPYAIYTEGLGASHFDDFIEIKRPIAIPAQPPTDVVRLYPKSDGKLYIKDWNNVERPASGIDSVSYAILVDQKPTNTAGGTSVGSTWTTRDLNTEVSDANNIVSLSSNSFTPIAGTYEIDIVCPFVSGASNSISAIRLRNVTTSTVVDISHNDGGALNGEGSSVVLKTIFIANGTDSFHVQYRTSAGRATNGLGLARNEAGAPERYTRVVLKKLL